MIRTAAFALGATSLLSVSMAQALPLDSFTFTPTFQDPDPGLRHWVRNVGTFTETLPSGRVNVFKVVKTTKIHGLDGIMYEKVGEANFFVFVPDSNASRMELWWARSGGQWNLMGQPKNVSPSPAQRIDPG